MTIALVVVLGACSHGDVFAPPPPVRLGPFTDTLPRRLTFNQRDDWMPSVRGEILVFSRQGETDPSVYTGVPREFCIAMMPVEGGTLSRTMCPHDWLRFDTLVDTWFEPSLSPDGSRLAYVWQRGYSFSTLGFRDAYLVVTDADRPADTTQVRRLVQYSEGGTLPRTADIATRITWIGEDTLRFLATRETIDKVKGGGAERVTDTTMVGLSVMELDLQSDAMRVVPGSDSTSMYANAPGGGIWILREPAPAEVLHLDVQSGVRTPVGLFNAPAFDLIEVGGRPVAAVDTTGAGGTAIERIESNGVVTRFRLFANRIVRIVPAGGNRVIVEVEQFVRLFGAPTDLWLVALP